MKCTLGVIGSALGGILAGAGGGAGIGSYLLPQAGSTTAGLLLVLACTAIGMFGAGFAGWSTFCVDGEEF